MPDTLAPPSLSDTTVKDQATTSQQAATDQTIENNTLLHCGTIAIIGRPNVGKSTLLNALIGQKISITSRKAQTTRHPITGIHTTPTAQYIFVDTPGFQLQHGGTLNRSLNRAVKAALASVDVVLYVVEAGHYGADDHTVLKLLPGMQAPSKYAKNNLPLGQTSDTEEEHTQASTHTENTRPAATEEAIVPSTPAHTSASPAIFVLANKLDRIPDREELPAFLEHLTTIYPFTECIPLSAKRPDHIESLLQTIERHLPMRPPQYDSDTLTEHSERFLASEIMREKIFRHTGDELPYQTTVEITQFIQEGALRRIFATIFVERETHRAMILGAKGSKLKQINTEARQDMVRLFGGPIYLEVWIKVKKGTADQKIM